MTVLLQQLKLIVAKEFLILHAAVEILILAYLLLLIILMLAPPYLHLLTFPMYITTLNSLIIVHPTTTTSYTVTGTANGCSSTVATTVTVMNNPHASFIASPDSGYVPLSVVFTNTSSGATSYTWYIDSSLQATSTDFSATFEEEGTFLITLIADNGVCPPDTAYKMLITLLPAIIEIPNVFTPNNDAINDLWIVKGKVKNVVILNRWGNVVFQGSDNFTGWNGKDQHGKACTSGVYFYKIEDTNEEVHVGFLTLVR